MTRSSHSYGYVAFVVGFLAVTMLATSWTFVEADEVPAFFLKIAKNIPRVGRSGRFDDYFLKSARNVPRVSRSDGFVSPSETMSVQADIEPFNGPIKRMLHIPAPEDPTWSHFPLAIEGPPELWRTLAGYTSEQAGYGSDDIDNEIWQRNKRTGDFAAKA